MDYPCGNFGDCSFSLFGSIVRTNRHRQTDTDAGIIPLHRCRRDYSDYNQHVVKLIMPFDCSVYGELVEHDQYSLVRRHAAELRDVSGRMSRLLHSEFNVCGRRGRLPVLPSPLLGLRRSAQTLLHRMVVQRLSVPRPVQRMSHCWRIYRCQTSSSSSSSSSSSIKIFNVSLSDR